MKPTRTIPLFVPFYALVFSSNLLGGEAPNSAPDLVRASGVRGGLVVHAGSGDGAWTGGLRVNERYLVQGLERDARRVAEARATLRKQGMPGKVTVLPWRGKLLPYADNTVNLLIVDSPRGVPVDEMMRALAPRGIAWVKSGAVWTRHEKTWPADIDEWTHFLHGPDNNAVAEDTRIEPVRYLQWVCGPRWARSHDHLSSVSAAVSARGRLFYVVDEGPIASVKSPAVWKLVARDAFNGVLLWKKDIDPWEDHLRPFRSGPAELPRRLVAVGERVYVTLGYGKPVTALDAATGDLVRTFDGTENTHEIVVQGGNLHLVISASLDQESPTTGRVLRRFSPWRDGYDEYITEYMPKHIRVVDAESGELVWKKEDRTVANILPLTLVVSEGKVFFQNETHVMALDARSGTEQWRSARPSIRHRYAWLTPTLVVKDGVLLSADRSAANPVDTGGTDDARLEWRVSSNHLLTAGEIMALSAESGKKLWTAPCHEGFNSPVDLFVVDGRVWSGVLAWGKQPGITKVYDLDTGEVVAERSPDQQRYTLGFGHARCYRHKATPKYVIHGRAGVEFVDMSADRVIADHWVRGACQYGILPANGLVYAPSHSCACYITAKLDGFNALSGRRSPPPEETPRLEKGPAYASATTEARRRLEPSAWPTFRGDAARTGSTQQRLSPELTPKWETPLPGPLTAVVVGGGKLYVAQREAHTVHALSAADGTALWCFTAGGRVDSPPTLYGGLVYFGSADGWVYCLRAEDGALVWRFRVAPEERQIVSYDQLESVWPVHGNVLVHALPTSPDRPVVYAAAGRSSFVDDGLHFCGVDAVSGELLVKRRISHRDPTTGLEPQARIRGVIMPGAIPDVLSSDGSSVFMRHQRFDFEGNPLSQDIDHLYSSAGFLDDTWWHRTYLQFGCEMRGGYGGWTFAGKNHVSGRALVKKGNRAFGFGRKDYTITGSHLGLKSEYHLFGAEIPPSPTDSTVPGGKNKRRRPPGNKGEPIWSRSISFYPRAMLASRDALLLAGPADIADLTAKAPRGDVHLWVVSANDGKKLAEYRLKAAPVYDSFAAAASRLYFTTVDGRVACWD